MEYNYIGAHRVVSDAAQKVAKFYLAGPHRCYVLLLTLTRYIVPCLFRLRVSRIDVDVTRSNNSPARTRILKWNQIVGFFPSGTNMIEVVDFSSQEQIPDIFV